MSDFNEIMAVADKIEALVHEEFPQKPVYVIAMAMVTLLGEMTHFMEEKGFQSNDGLGARDVIVGMLDAALEDARIESRGGSLN